MEIRPGDGHHGGDEVADTGRQRGVPALPVVLLGLIGVATWLWWDAGRPGWPSDPPGLALPAEGEVVAGHLDDGSPVFVARFGSHVEVLTAAAPGPPLDADGRAHPLTVYCGSSGLFEDLAHGSVFGRDGRWNGGPAPASLARYPSRVDDDRVLVTADAQPRDRPGRSTTTTRPPPTGPSCRALPPRERTAATTRHEADDTVHLRQLTADAWAWVDARFEPVDAEPDAVRICDTRTCDEVALAFPDGRRPGNGPLLARLDADEQVRVLVPPRIAAQPQAAPSADSPPGQRSRPTTSGA